MTPCCWYEHSSTPFQVQCCELRSETVRWSRRKRTRRWRWWTVCRASKTPPSPRDTLQHTMARSQHVQVELQLENAAWGKEGITLIIDEIGYEGSKNHPRSCMQKKHGFFWKMKDGQGKSQLLAGETAGDERFPGMVKLPANEWKSKIHLREKITRLPWNRPTSVVIQRRQTKSIQTVILLQLGSRAFCVAGPVAYRTVYHWTFVRHHWTINSLFIKFSGSAPTLSTFTNMLKTSFLTFLYFIDLSSDMRHIYGKWCQRSLWHQLALSNCEFHS